jgi:hypothetical protein
MKDNREQNQNGANETEVEPCLESPANRGTVRKGRPDWPRDTACRTLTQARDRGAHRYSVDNYR